MVPLKGSAVGIGENHNYPQQGVDRQKENIARTYLSVDFVINGEIYQLNIDSVTPTNSR